MDLYWNNGSWELDNQSKEVHFNLSNAGTVFMIYSISRLKPFGKIELLVDEMDIRLTGVYSCFVGMALMADSKPKHFGSWHFWE